MARVQIYESQIRPGGPGQGNVRAGDFSSNVGEGIASLAQPMLQSANVKVVEAERQRQVDRTRFTANYFDMTSNVDRDIQAARDNLADGAEGYVPQVRSALDTHTAAFLGTISDPELRNEFRARVAQYRSSTFDTESAFASARRQESMGTNTTRAIDTAANRVIATPTPENLHQTRDTLYGLIDNASDIPQSLRSELRQRINGSTAVGYLTGLGEQNAQAALETVQSGVFANDLTPEQTRSLTDRFQADIRARQADQRRELAAAQQQAREQWQMVERRLNDGDPTLTEQDIAQAGQLAQTANLPATAYDVGRARIRFNTIKQYRNAPAGELRQAIGTVRERIAAAGDHASPDDAIRLAQMESMLPARTQENQNDPLGSYQRGGGHVAPLDASNPASVRARIAASRAAERQTGFFGFFMPQEVAQLQQVANSGPNGRLQVANQLAMINRLDSAVADRAARQLAPNDAVLRRAIRLGPVTRQAVLEGDVARHQLNQRIALPDGSAASLDALSAAWFNRNIAPQLARQNPEALTDVLETARAYYAEVNRRSGTLARTDFDEGNFARAVSVALGSEGGRGGTGFWSMGPRTQQGTPYGVILPTNMSQGDFERVMAHLPLARYGESWHGSSNGVPHWASGQAMNIDDLRARFVPIMVDDGVYEFRAPNGGAVINEHGQPFRLNAYTLNAYVPAMARARRARPPEGVRVRASARTENTLSGR